MHTVPGVSDLNALRLAAIPPGKDWRALPAKLRLLESDTRHSGYLGVQDGGEPSNTVIGNTKGCNAWGSVADARIGAGPNKHPGPYGVQSSSEPAHTVLATARMDTGWGSVADPRTSKVHRAGPYGVEDKDAPSGAVIASADVTCGSFAWTDPRLDHGSRSGNWAVQDPSEPAAAVIAHANPYHGANTCDPRLSERTGRLNGGYGVEDAQQPAHAVVSTNRPDVTWASVAEPRVAAPKPSKHNGHLGVQAGADPARTIIGALRSGNGWGSVADPRVTCEPREGSYGVADAARPLPTSVIGQAITQNGPWSWPDPRVADASGHFAPTHALSLGADGVLVCSPIGDARPLDLGSNTSRNDLVIVALDGSFHRPLSDLELALLQGFPLRVRGEWLCLPGSREVRRRGIGNAIPPLTARAIAEACLEVMADHTPLSSLLTSSDRKVWVQPLPRQWFGAQPEGAQR